MLADLLNRPGIAGHALTSAKARRATATADSNETRFRNASLIELHLATALHTLDPGHPLGRDILAAYAKDLRGLFAAHARRTLARPAV